MNKTINTKPLEIITLEFEDNKSLNMMFNNYSMMILDDEFEGFIKVISDVKEKPYSSGAKLIYAGCKGYNFYKKNEETVDFDYIKRIIINMDLADILEILVIASSQIVDKEKAKNLKTQLTQTLQQMK